MPRREPSVHPPFRWFADRIDGRLAAARAAKLDAHLAGGCAACSAREARLRRTIGTMREGPLETPPRAVRAAAVRLRREARLRAALDTARGIVARLVFDGRAAPAMALRTAAGDERRLLWAAGPWEIDACLVAGTRTADLLGQVVPADETAAPLALDGTLIARCGAQRQFAALARDGRFAFRGLLPGVWTLEGTIGAERVTVPPFVVEAGI